MERRCPLKAAISAVLLALAGSLPAGTLDLRLNGSAHAAFAIEDLRARERLVPVGGVWIPGVPVEDLYPVMTEANAITISSAASAVRVEHADLGERLGQIVIAVKNGRAVLYLPADLGSRPIEDLEGLDVAGTPLGRREMEVWASWEGVPVLKQIVATYSERHGLDIRVLEVPDTRAKVLTVSRGGGAVGDVVMVQSDHIPELVGMRALQPLDSLGGMELAESAWAAFRTEDGHRWAVPFFRDVQLVYYNSSLVGRPPDSWTLADLERMGEGLAGRDLLPLAWNAYSAYWLIPFQMGFGKDALLEADGEIRADDEATIRAIRYLVGLRDRGLLTVVERDAMMGLFATGKAGIMLSGSYSIPELRRLGIPFGVAAFPRTPAGRALRSLEDVKGLSVSRVTRNPLLARRLIQYLCRADIQLGFALAVDKLPAAMAATGRYAESSPYGPALLEALSSSITIPPVPAYRAFKDALWQLMRLVFSGQIRVEEAVAQAQRATAAINQSKGATP